MGQMRLHERLLQAAGVRIDRAGAALLYMLESHGDRLRVTVLAELLGVDTPTVSRKVQQLEREGLVVREPDPVDRRATRIALTPAGRSILDGVLAARRNWLNSLLEGWKPSELEAFAAMLHRFAASVDRDLEDSGGGRDKPCS